MRARRAAAFTCPDSMAMSTLALNEKVAAL